ncbi:MAG: Uma2 family endonuclease, partial [Myxococcales bacterium]|nr:Uma2 family endonuclease [Myxococcales bacterium]
MSEARRVGAYDDLRRLPPHVIGEIIGGEVLVSPRPAPKHAFSGTQVGADILGAFGRRRGPGPGGWIILFEPELHLGEDVLVPDIAGWRRARLPEVPNTAAITLVPDCVCEVLSPSNGRRDRLLKRPLYAAAGVGHVWLVASDQQTLEVYRREGAYWLLLVSHAGDQRVRAEPFVELEL